VSQKPLIALSSSHTAANQTDRLPAKSFSKGASVAAEFVGPLGREFGPRVVTQNPFRMAAPHLPLLKCLLLLQLLSAGALSLGGRRLFGRERLLQPRLSDEALLNRAADELQLSPPWNAPRWLWSFAWKVQTWAMPLLHMFDQLRPQDTFLNLNVLWWKAISGNRRLSSTYDNGFSFDLLPPLTRRVTQFPLCYLFPNLHHQNVALRTAFMDKQLAEQLAIGEKEQQDVVVVTLGAGFDTRSLRFLARGPGQSTSQFYEMDLPAVVEQKRRLLQERFLLRRPGSRLPVLLPGDLNIEQDVVAAFDSILLQQQQQQRQGRGLRVVLMVEAVLMYVKDANVLPALTAAVNAAQRMGAKDAVFIFSDRFPGVIEQLSAPEAEGLGDGREQQLVAEFLKRAGGLEITNWTPKPGRARHMGTALKNFY